MQKYWKEKTSVSSSLLNGFLIKFFKNISELNEKWN